MMMSRPRPTESSSTKEESVIPKQQSATVTEPPKNTEEHLVDIERRLAALGGPTSVVKEEETEEEKEKNGGYVPPQATPDPTPAAAATEKKEEENKTPAAPTPSLVATASAESKPSAAGGVQPKGGKNALLARIMAAQERARMAQQQQGRKDDKSPAAIHQEKIMKALSGETADETKIAVTTTTVEPPAVEAKADDPPPPFEMAQIPQQQVADYAPPPFEAVEETVMKQVTQHVEAQEKPEEAKEAPAPSPSAPPIDDMHEEVTTEQHNTGTYTMEGIERIVPPPINTAEENALPPTFEQFEEELFAFDLDGNALSPEERRAMAEEQRAILEQILKEKAANDAAIAAAAAESFDSRSNTAAAAAAGGETAPAPTQTLPTNAAAASSSAVETGVERPERTVEIGSGQRVALHGQERTRAAIASGTAILVQCMNCQNWMQVVDTATLMYCPVCSVVSPVIRQSEVMTKEEAVQLTLDRRMAEQLQNEEYKGESKNEEKESGSSMPSFIRRIDERLRGAQGEDGAAQRQPLQQQQQKQSQDSKAASTSSWWDYFSFGITDTRENERRRGEIAVSRPPSSTSPSRRQLHSVDTGEETVTFSNVTSSPNSERAGLLSANVDGAATEHRDLPAARVAERRPFFSCVADSMTSVASSLGSALTTQTLAEDNEGNIHGVDASSLLAVTSAGRDKGGVGDGSGSYHAIPNEE